MANQSETGVYFMTATGRYFPGMHLVVTRDFRPENSTHRDEKAVVIRVESLGGGHVGVAIQTKSPLPRCVLFVCVGNACRSPMAEALARHLAPDAIIPSSAGLAPLGYIPAATHTVLTEVGLSCERFKSKSVNKVNAAEIDLVINMAAQPVAKLFKAGPPVEHWDVADPFGSDLSVYRNTRDELKKRILELAKRLRASASAG
jgi:arsenate reductase (thioredoxin)